MTEHPGIYIGLSKPFKDVKPAHKEERDLRMFLDAIQKDVENAYKAQSEQTHERQICAYRAYLAEYYGVPEKNVEVLHSDAKRTIFATITAENEQPIYTAAL